MSVLRACTQVFEPDGYEQTYAEMSKQQKTEISHRTLSLIKLHAWLAEHADELRSAKRVKS